MRKIVNYCTVLFFLTVGGVNLNGNASPIDAGVGGGNSCKIGPRCPSGTYKYCDEFGKGYKCVCYFCN